MVIAGLPWTAWLLLVVAVGLGGTVELRHWLRRRRALDGARRRSGRGRG